MPSSPPPLDPSSYDPIVPGRACTIGYSGLSANCTEVVSPERWRSCPWAGLYFLQVLSPMLHGPSRLLFHVRPRFSVNAKKVCFLAWNGPVWSFRKTSCQRAGRHCSHRDAQYRAGWCRRVDAARTLDCCREQHVALVRARELDRREVEAHRCHDAGQQTDRRTILWPEWLHR